MAVRSGQESNQYHTPAMCRQGAWRGRPSGRMQSPSQPCNHGLDMGALPRKRPCGRHRALARGQTERISIHTLCFPCSDQESIPGSRSRGAASLQAARPVPGFGAPTQHSLCPTAGPEACPPPSPPGPTPPAGHPRAEICMLPAPARRAQPQPCGSPPPTLSVRGLSTRPPSSMSAGQELDTCSGQFASCYPGL